MQKSEYPHSVKGKKNVYGFTMSDSSRDSWFKKSCKEKREEEQRE